MKRLSSVAIYDGGESKIISVSSGEQVKLQAIGSGSATLRGRLNSECNWDSIALLKGNDFSKSDSINSTEVYMADCSGYTEITIEASGFVKIYATILA